MHCKGWLYTDDTDSDIDIYKLTPPHICVHRHTYTHTYVTVHVHIYPCVYTHIPMCTCVHLCIHVHICSSMYTCMSCMCAHLYIHVRIHTHIWTYILPLKLHCLFNVREIQHHKHGSDAYHLQPCILPWVYWLGCVLKLSWLPEAPVIKGPIPPYWY